MSGRRGEGMEERVAELTDFEAGLLRLIVSLQARCDALEMMAQVLGRRLQLGDGDVRAMLERLRDTAHQKRLESIESSHAHLASLLDDRADLGAVDFALLEKLLPGEG